VAIFLVERVRFSEIIVQVVVQSLPCLFGVTDGDLTDRLVLMDVEEVGSSTTVCFGTVFCRRERRGGVSGGRAGAFCMFLVFDLIFGA